jgi:hypothetical protein
MSPALAHALALGLALGRAIPVLAAPPGPAEVRLPADRLEALVRKELGTIAPGLAPDVGFRVEEHRVDGLWEGLHVQLLTVRFLAGDGTVFRDAALALHRGLLTPCAVTSGGHGLMSAVVWNGQCYYSYSWGSGIHRSHLGRIAVTRGTLTRLDSVGYPHLDLFVRIAATGPRVERGGFERFNVWHGGEPVGTVAVGGSGLVLLEDTGRGQEASELRPDPGPDLRPPPATP